MTKILLVAGHGKGDPGAVSGKEQEHEVAKQIVSDTEKILSEYNVEVDVLLDGYNLIDKINYTHQRTYDVSIEVHLDAASATATGVTTFYYTGSEPSRVFGEVLHKNLVNTTGLRSRGLIGDMSSRLGRLAFVRDTKGFAFLLEVGFITNPNDLRIAKEKAAIGIANGLIERYGLRSIKEKPFTDVPSTHPYYDACVWAKEKGVADGYGDGRLGVDEQLSVGRFLAFLKKYDMYLHNKR